MYVQGSYIYVGDSFNTLWEGGTVQTQRRVQEAYGVLNLASGWANESWGAELYVRNVADERGDVWINAVTWDGRITTNRPRTAGVRMHYNF